MSYALGLLRMNIPRAFSQRGGLLLVLDVAIVMTYLTLFLISLLRTRIVEDFFSLPKLYHFVDQDIKN